MTAPLVQRLENMAHQRGPTDPPVTALLNEAAQMIRALLDMGTTKEKVDG